MLIPADSTFYAGVLSTLQMVTTSINGLPGGEALYHQIVAKSDVGHLCRVARSLDVLDQSGLVSFGYAIPNSDAVDLADLKFLTSAQRRERERRVIVSAQKGDPLARSVLMRDYEVVVKTILRRKFGWFLDMMPGRHLEYQDLAQEARYEVLRALQSFDPSREDANFRSLVDIRVPDHLHGVIRQREGAVSYPKKAYVEKTANVLWSTAATVDEEGRDLVEEIADDGWDDAMIEFAEKMEFAAKVQSLMWFLPDRQHFMLRVFFGFDGPALPKSVIAKDLGMTTEAVSTVLNEGLETLRGWITAGKTPESRKRSGGKMTRRELDLYRRPKRSRN